MKHTGEPIPKIEPYVTAKGGVVILNGPFPLDQAEQVKALCEAALDLLGACKAALARFQEDRVDGYHEQHPVVLLEQAIAKAEGGGAI